MAKIFFPSGLGWGDSKYIASKVRRAGRGFALCRKSLRSQDTQISQRLLVLAPKRKYGSERESVRTRILRSFLQSDELGLGGRQALRLQEQIVHVAISSATPEQRFDVAVHRFDHSHRHLGPAIVEDTLQVIQ